MSSRSTSPSSRSVDQSSKSALIKPGAFSPSMSETSKTIANSVSAGIKPVGPPERSMAEEVPGSVSEAFLGARDSLSCEEVRSSLFSLESLCSALPQATKVPNDRRAITTKST